MVSATEREGGRVQERESKKEREERKKKIRAEKIVGVYYSEINLEFLTNRIRK